MLQSEAPRWEENKDIACLQLALPFNGVENYTFSEREECSKVNMISMAWDKTDDDISSSQFQFNDRYACLGSEEESNWSPKGALLNTRDYYDVNGFQAQADERSFVMSLSRDCDDVNGLQAHEDHRHCQAQVVAPKPKAKDEDHQAQNYGVITGSRNAPRICVDCKTTKTPLWRSGPHGPKSLCNACGIRYRKAKRALSAFGNGDQMAAYKSRLPKRKQNKTDQDEDYKFVHHKKRSRMSIPSCKKNNINVKFSAKQSPHSFQRVFAEEEKEAAVLLMALSCGLVLD